MFYFGNGDNVLNSLFDMLSLNDGIEYRLNIDATIKEPKLLYSKQYNSFCVYDGSMYINDGKVSTSFWSVEKAMNNSFIPCELIIKNIDDSSLYGFYFNEYLEHHKLTGELL